VRTSKLKQVRQVKKKKRHFNLHGTKNIYQLLGIRKAEALKIVQNIDNYYRSYPIKKSSKKLRWIDAPQGLLKKCQKNILERILYQFRAHESAVGFVKHMNVKNGAERHLGNKVVLCVDVHNFFSSLSLFQVYAAFGYILKKLTILQTTFSYTKDDIELLVKLTTYKSKVPQGAPTSPALANIICRQLDRELQAIAVKNNLIYTRYADDISFSHRNQQFKITKILNSIKKILNYYGLKLNSAKTRVLRPHKRMCITGVVINDKLSVPKYVWRNIRAQLHNLNKNNETLSSDEYQKLRGKIEWIGLFRPQLKTTFLDQLGKVILTS
jgi:retron-type reverse transcriptase